MIRAECLAAISAIENHLVHNQYDQALQSQQQLKNQQNVSNMAINYINGLLFLVQKNSLQAIVSFNSVAKYFKDDVKFHNNLGHAHLLEGQAQSAVNCFERAIQIEPDKATTRYNLCCAYIAIQDGDRTLNLINPLLAEWPQNGQYWCAKGDAYRIKHKYKQAIHCYKQCLIYDQEHSAANSNLGVLLASFGQFKTALGYASKAVEHAPNSMLSHMNLGRCLAKLEQFDEAMLAFADAYEIDSNSPFLCVEIGDMWVMSGDIAEATVWFQKALILKENFIPAIAGLARVLLHQGKSAQALAFIEQQVSEVKTAKEIKQVVADALWDEGDVSSALTVLKETLADNQQNPNYLAKAAQMLASSGDIGAAMDHYKEALSLNPNCIPALNGMAVKQRGKFSHDSAQHINEMLKNTSLRDGSKSLLNNALAYYFDGNRAWEQAADHMALANQLQWEERSSKSWDYEKSLNQSHFQMIKNTFNHSYFDQADQMVSNSNEPVFIVAMPRSGTTLTEQILAGHPEILGIGERNFISQSFLQLCHKSPSFEAGLEQLNTVSNKKLKAIAISYLANLNRLKVRDEKPNAKHVVDKMPDNYSLIGWILTLFPKAKIIHCRRDPRDVYLSCWMTQFGQIQWACRESDLLARIKEYQDMMTHWRQVVPNRFIEIDYEELVSNQEGVTRKLLEYIGLPWDESCLRFYQSDRVVRTASISQVRKPIYKKSVGKWKNYAPYIPALNQINISEGMEELVNTKQ